MAFLRHSRVACSPLTRILGAYGGQIADGNGPILLSKAPSLLRERGFSAYHLVLLAWSDLSFIVISSAWELLAFVAVVIKGNKSIELPITFTVDQAWTSSVIKDTWKDQNFWDTRIRGLNGAGSTEDCSQLIMICCSCFISVPARGVNLQPANVPGSEICPYGRTYEYCEVIQSFLREVRSSFKSYLKKGNQYQLCFSRWTH